MDARHPIPIETLKRLLRYDEDGRLFWLPRTEDVFLTTPGRSAAHACANWNARWAGKEAFTAVGAKGYRFGNLLCKVYLAHHIVFALHNARWSALQVDHIDRDRGNNRPGNLREATQHENARNGSSHKDSTSRFRGVSWCTSESVWRAQCIDNFGRNRFLGRFTKEHDAAAAHDRAAAEWHGPFASLNFPARVETEAA